MLLSPAALRGLFYMSKISPPDDRLKNKYPVKITEERNDCVWLSTAFGDTKITFHYPEENPSDAIHHIATCLSYTGVFDDIKQNK